MEFSYTHVRCEMCKEKFYSQFDLRISVLKILFFIFYFFLISAKENSEKNKVKKLVEKNIVDSVENTFPEKKIIRIMVPWHSCA